LIAPLHISQRTVHNITCVLKNINMMSNPIRSIGMISPAVAFLIVSFSLGELGDGLNIFQGIYLVNVGWNEGAVGIALSMMGLTALISQTFAGDWVSTAGWFIVPYDKIQDNPGLFSSFRLWYF
jgi:hypothetical protein